MLDINIWFSNNDDLETTLSGGVRGLTIKSASLALPDIDNTIQTEYFNSNHNRSIEFF